MEEVSASPEDQKRAEEAILPGFQRDLEELLRQRPDLRPQPADDDAIFAIADRAVQQYHAATAHTPGLPRLSRSQLLELRRRLFVTHSTLGPFGELLTVDGVEDIVINGTRGGYLEFGDRRRPLPVEYSSDDELERFIRWYAEHSGKHFDAANPIVTITLRDGTRINAIRPPVAKPMQVTIRLHQVDRFRRLDDLLREGAIPVASIPFFRAAVEARLNGVVSGPTASGKTTFTRVLAMLIPKGERTCVLETETELWLHDLRDDFFSLEEREANVEEKGEITLQDLFQKGALRQRPRRIIVGEVRGKEALDMVHAMTSGHDGSLTTVHASGPRLALNRLSMLAMSADANLAPAVVSQMVGTGIDLVVHLGMYQRGERLLRRLGFLGFVDHNLESPEIGPILQEICHYRPASDDWEWDVEAILYMPDKVRDKFQAAGIDDLRLARRVAGSDDG
jgi:pilus assembly protein CpaF